MATTLTDFGVSSEKIEFSGSTEDDIAHAKAFWQSMQLLPPMESRLVSSDIKQRLKAAPPGHQAINTNQKIPEDTPELTAFLAKAQATQKQEKLVKLEKFSALRDADIAMLQKHRQERIEKEKISNHRGLRTRCPDDVDRAIANSDTEQDQDGEEPEDTRRAIEQFEQRYGQSTGADSDSD